VILKSAKLIVDSRDVFKRNCKNVEKA